MEVFYNGTPPRVYHRRMAYEAGFSPICPTLYQPLFLNDAVPEEHKSGIDMGRDLLRRSHVLYGCGFDVYQVGDEKDVGNVKISVWDGYEAARSI